MPFTVSAVAVVADSGSGLSREQGHRSVPGSGVGLRIVLLLVFASIEIPFNVI